MKSSYEYFAVSMNVVKDKIIKKTTAGSSDEIPPTTHHRTTLSRNTHPSRRVRDYRIFKRNNEKDLVHPPMPVRKSKFPFNQFKYRPPKVLPNLNVPHQNASYVKLPKSFFGNASLGSIPSNIVKTQQKCVALEKTCEEFVPTVTSTPMPANKVVKNVESFGKKTKDEIKPSTEVNTQINLKNIFKGDEMAISRMSRFLADCKASVQRQEKESPMKTREPLVKKPSLLKLNKTPIFNEQEESFFQLPDINDKEQLSPFSNNAINFLDVILEHEKSNASKDWNVSLNENRFAENILQEQLHVAKEKPPNLHKVPSQVVKTDFLNTTEPISNCYPSGIDLLNNSVLKYHSKDSNLLDSSFEEFFNISDHKDRETTETEKFLNDFCKEEGIRKCGMDLKGLVSFEDPKKKVYSVLRQLMKDKSPNFSIFETPSRYNKPNNIFGDMTLKYLHENGPLPQKLLPIDHSTRSNPKSYLNHRQYNPPINYNYKRIRQPSQSSDFGLPPMDVNWEPYFPDQFSTPTRHVNDTFEADHRELAQRTDRILEAIEKDLTESPTFRYSPRRMF